MVARRARCYQDACGARCSHERAIGPHSYVRGSRSSFSLRSIPACAGKPLTICARLQPNQLGSIPACAGKPCIARAGCCGSQGPSPRVRGSRVVADDPHGSTMRGVHPRVCGEAMSKRHQEAASRKVHPRVCGEAPGARDCGRMRGSIPACAGKPPGRVSAEHGGSIPACAGKPSGSGRVPVAGSIPACAGKPAPRRRSGTSRGPSPRVRGSHSLASVPAMPRVHPRVCGEAALDGHCARRLVGSIPACAGKPGHRGRGCHPVGSIPACAGKPALPVPRDGSGSGPSPRVRGSPLEPLHRARPGVHPRVCGEAVRPTRHRRDACGSIPACAGKPRSGDTDGLQLLGPSPRVRGSPPTRSTAAPIGGSIPACAGKPGDRRLGRCRRVHPRVCGEAEMLRNRLPRCAGSIPACAGKPQTARRSRQPGVHPRVCGEAHAEGARIGGSGGSIPACAGKPDLEPRRGSLGGPSPRVRGSHGRSASASRSRGSIPACAGKPVVQTWPSRQGPSPRVRGSHWAARLIAHAQRVHPRVCGEASRA